jgi:hypothetical protein
MRTPGFGWAAVVLGASGLLGTPGIPIAAADTLPNGLTVSCAPVGTTSLTCVIGGCPRVGEDHNYNPDVVHARLPNGYQDELGINCVDVTTTTETVPLNEVGPGFTFGVQACRKVAIGNDKCGPWSNYTWNPPQPQGPSPASNATGGPCAQWSFSGSVLLAGSNGMQTQIDDWSGSGPVGAPRDAHLLNPKVVPMKVQDGSASGGVRGNRFDVTIAWLTPEGQPSDLTSHYTGTIDPAGKVGGKMADTNGGKPGYSDTFTVSSGFSCAQ